jgi:hypothetical protein
MNNRVNSDKPKEWEPNYNKKGKEYISKATAKKLVMWGLILMLVVTVYFIYHYIDRYIGNLILK